MKKKHQKPTRKRKYVLYIGDCNVCKKEIYNTDAFVIYVDKSRRCWECHKQESEQHERQRQDQDT